MPRRRPHPPNRRILIALLRAALGLFAGVLLAGNEPRWTGSRACRPCHTAVYESYTRTAMAASSGRAGAGALERFDDAAIDDNKRSGYRYRVDNNNRRYTLVLEDKAGGKATLDLPFFIGSGAVARSYLLERNGFLYQSPVAYYSAKAKWDFAPGYGRYSQPFLTRPILPGCLQCHATGIQHRSNTQNGYAPEPFLEGGVGCKRCHGPGRRHIDAMKSGSRLAGSRIVNPSRLDAERRESICAQCHLTGEIRITRAGRDVQSFIPGDRLADHFAVFVRSDAPAEMRVTSHVENLAQSACKKASGDRLGCGACHDPHSVPKPSERAAWFRSKCLNCHQTQSCKASVSSRQARKDDCASCHMPRNTVTDAEHVVYTDHAIGRPAKPFAGGREASLIPFAGGQPDDRDLGIAYAILSQRERNAAYRSRAVSLLEAAVRSGRSDTEALMYLAGLYEEMSLRERAVALYEQAFRMDPKQLTASVNLGAIRMEQGKYAEAIRLWRDALSKNPALLLVRSNLAMALLKIGEPEQAALVLREAAAFNPSFMPPRELRDQLRLQ